MWRSGGDEIVRVLRIFIPIIGTCLFLSGIGWVNRHWDFRKIEPYSVKFGVLPINHPINLSYAHGLLLGTKMDVNAASISELDLVPGISIRKAGQIIQYRELKGGIVNIQDLIQIKGIGKKTLAKMAPYLRIDAQ